MTAAFGPVYEARNEPVREYAPGSAERASLQAALAAMAGERRDLPLIIDGRVVRTGRLQVSISPHAHAHVLGDAHLAGPTAIAAAIAAAKRAWPGWSGTDWEARARVFLKAADLISGPWRDRLNAATMLGQSKTVHQAEIDAAAELADFLRFNVAFMLRLYTEQPISRPGVRNRIDYRPLEGFVYSVTPFNFTAIAGNLPCAPALMGNTVVWKPSSTAKLSAHFVMAVLLEAGLPDGVINLVYGDAAQVTAAVLADADFAGLHFTGSTSVFEALQREISSSRYRNFPRIVGETGGKNFALAHASADITALTTAIVRGAFEYQGQKCSATSRLFVPRTMWPELKDRLMADTASIRMGDVADFGMFMGAVIDETSWSKLDEAIAAARASNTETVLTGAAPDKTVGYFVPPTLIETTDLGSRFMAEEFFGPIVTAFVYDDDAYDDIIGRIDQTSVYGLTGSIFAREAGAVARALEGLRYAAGNVYVNDKSTGAVVGQQPFGGARASGTNDKAGSMWNLARWVSPRTIKESFVPPTDYAYPSMRR
jgi:1-pyrroline-5-carboxylate dehydrogenase